MVLCLLSQFCAAVLVNADASTAQCQASTPAPWRVFYYIAFIISTELCNSIWPNGFCASVVFGHENNRRLVLRSLRVQIRRGHFSTNVRCRRCGCVSAWPCSDYSYFHGRCTSRSTFLLHATPPSIQSTASSLSGLCISTSRLARHTRFHVPTERRAAQKSSSAHSPSGHDDGSHRERFSQSHTVARIAYSAKTFVASTASNDNHVMIRRHCLLERSDAVRVSWLRSMGLRSHCA